MMGINEETSILISFNEGIMHELICAFRNNKNRHAIWVDDKYYSYEQLYSFASKIALAISNSNENICVILSSRNIVAYASILGVLMAGKAYVVLSDKDPLNRLCDIYRQIGSSLLIVDKIHIREAAKLSKVMAEITSIVFPDMRKSDIDACNYNFSKVNKCFPIEVKEQYFYPKTSYKYAYLMFTSGSTGKPKGIGITHVNLKTYVKNIISRANPNNKDRFSQITELTFDFSVHDIFCCWSIGACLYVLPSNYIMGIPKYIIENKISFWASVPSTIAILQQLKRLKSNCFQSIRYSIFCGEPLTDDVASIWHSSSPNSVIDNLYGPTEATVAFTGYRWHSKLCMGIIPIGFPFSGQKVCLLDKNNKLVKCKKEVGEICLVGSQVAEGYWHNPTLTKRQFIKLNGIHCYKTGDLALWNDEFGLIYKGRSDDQIKIRGYRVEKIEIETTIRKIAETDNVAVIPKDKDSSGNVLSLVCFITEPKKPIDIIKALCQGQLPEYMVPAKFIEMKSFPYNKNGKLDCQRLLELI